jgi:hypothetical protein
MGTLDRSIWNGGGNAPYIFVTGVVISTTGFPWLLSLAFGFGHTPEVNVGAGRPRSLKTVTPAGGSPGPYELAIDPTRSTLDTAVRVARLAEEARIDALFVPDLLSFGAQGTIGAQEPLVFVSALSQVTSHIGLIATV